MARKLKTLTSDLRRILGAGLVSDDAETLASHAGDKWFASHPPEVVVRAKRTQDVSKVLAYANKVGVPVTPRGAGYGYVGGCVPLRGGIVLSVAGMQRIKEIHFEDCNQ